MTKKHILIVASTFPASNNDPVPTFVKDQISAMKKLDSNLRFTVIAPHDTRSNTNTFSKHPDYNEYRFHYMWPKSLERLAGQGGIVPSLKKHPYLYAVIPFFLIAQFFTVLRLTLKLKPDIINAHWIIPQGFICILVGFIAHKKVITTVHGGDVFTFNNTVSNAIKHFVLKNATEVVVNSSATKDRCNEIYSGRSYQVIPMGVSFENFNKKIKKQSDTLNILFVGRLSEEKGIKYLIKALATLKRQNIKFKAKIVGSGPEEVELKQLTKFLGLSNNIEFTGWVNRDNIADYYDWASVFVGPSIESDTGWKEALGVVFLEASAAGLPIITTQTGGIVDIVKNNETGFLVKPKSSSEIAKKLIELQQDSNLRSRLGSNAQSFVQKNFSWTSIAKQYNNIIKNVDKLSIKLK